MNDFEKRRLEATLQTSIRTRYCITDCCPTFSVHKDTLYKGQTKKIGTPRLFNLTLITKPVVVFINFYVLDLQLWMLGIHF